MLELKGIEKIYPTGGENVHALRGIDLQFRSSEFVSILGPSGCGKTTMLNIIGGLDHCTSGDLEINGKSTRDFRDRDWDSYRNHSIGFVFQNYNLIPHQSVLSNVELALTLAGVSKKERRERAKKALERVGLANQMRKRPTQMSGGQMQRVAIARAIVNDPDIILADEPTGALDTETSLQVMDILKEISKDRLVIMVTHNPDIAEKYSTRIVRMLDGKITGDSNPLSEAEYSQEQEKCREKAKIKQKMPKMKFHTAFGLSLKNLFTKRARTILTCFAGSIGIIGIALIYAVSQGTNDYIDLIQEETLSSYPITIEAQSTDMSSMITAFIGDAESLGKHENDAVYQEAVMYNLANSFSAISEYSNDLAAFNDFLEEERSDPENPLSEAITGIHNQYSTQIESYTLDTEGDVIKTDLMDVVVEAISYTMGMDNESTEAMIDTAFSFYDMSPITSTITDYSNMWQEMVPGENGEAVSDLVKKQYDLLYGRWPESYNEVVIFTDSENEINDLALYALGLISKDDVLKPVDIAASREAVEYSGKKWSYEEICGIEFTSVIPADCYLYDEETGMCTDLRDDQSTLRTLYDNGLKLKVVGIAKAAEGSISTMIHGTICYTSKLTRYMIDHAYETDAVKAQETHPDTDIFTGLLFSSVAEGFSDEEKAEKFVSYAATLTDSEKAELYMSTVGAPSDEEIQAEVDEYMENLTREDIVKLINENMGSEYAGFSPEMIMMYIDAMTDDELFELFNQYASAEIVSRYEQEVKNSFSTLTDSELAGMLDDYISTCSQSDLAYYYSKYFKTSNSTYEKNMEKLGCLDYGSPSSMNIYASQFNDKSVIEDAIERYNESVDDIHKIQYTDYVGLLMSSVTTIIKAVTYVLMAFVGVSLIVSSIMIGVITLISVQERTKEIGVLRSLGASKSNVSSMFNAETIIIGLFAGLFGIGFTLLSMIPLNQFLLIKTKLPDLKAVLPANIAVALVGVSVVLTLIAGIIPSRSAAKKDPVEALRTE